MKLYHGSTEVIERPVFGLGKADNDYGRGFYCTEHEELAKEWACGERKDGYANAYELDVGAMKVLDLNAPEFGILNWLAVLVANRNIQLRTPIQIEAKTQLLERFLPKTDGYDVIRGYRADDSYFSFVRSFLSNGISYRQLSLAMRLGNLGEQVMLKSRRAFRAVKPAGHVIAEAAVYYPLRKTRDENARKAFLREAGESDLGGVFIRDILAERMEADDARLR